VIVLNGPSGVGKTTAGRILAARVANGACVHGDALRDFVVSRVDDEVQLGLGYVNAASVAANFVHAGYERVVVDYVFEEQRHLTRFVDAFEVDCDLHVVTLSSDRVEGSVAGLGTVVDASGLTPEQVADAVESVIAQA
jgi:hypothetical protein